MWVMLNDAFLSIVSKDCSRGEVLVRARRPGDIEKIFPEAAVEKTVGTDYRFRARVDQREASAAIAAEVARIAYPNFKDSVHDEPLHRAYLRVWTAMLDLQPGPRPYAGPTEPLDLLRGSGWAQPKKKKRLTRRPPRDALSTAITKWIRSNWREQWWGMTDCDRCAARTSAHPCATCPRWGDLIQQFRKGELR